MEKCQRCFKNDALLQCMNCPTIRNLCNTCDKIVHNLPSKLNHTRIPVENLTLNLNTKELFTIQNQTQIEQEPKYASITPPSIIQLNNTNTINNTNDNSIMNFDNIITQNKLPDEINISINDDVSDFQTINANKKEDNNKSIKLINNYKSKSVAPSMKLDSPTRQINDSVFNKQLLVTNNYSKEYVNEIKNIFKKEKDNLEYKNKALETSINKLKMEFNHQIINISKELEDGKLNNISTIKNLKENHENEMIEIKKNFDIEKSALKEDIITLENEKQNISNKFITEIENKDLKIKNLEKEIEKLKETISQKDDEIFNMKNSFDEMSTQYEQKYNDATKNLMNEYENKIKDMISNFENSKNNLINLVDEREKDVKYALDEKNKVIFELNESINNLKEELKCHKANLIKIKNDKNGLLQENIQMKDEIFQFQCNNQVWMNEINKLKKENEDLYIQIDKLKIELSRMDKIIYGRVRTYI